MTSAFPLWTSLSCVVTFQQHLHTEYTFLNWYVTPGHAFPIRIFWIEGCFWQTSYSTKGSVPKGWSRRFVNFMVVITIWLTGTKWQSHRWPGICFLCRNHIPSLLDYDFSLILLLGHLAGATSGAEHAYPSGAPDVTPFSGVQVTQSLVFCVICFIWCPCCVSLFAMALSVHFDCMKFWPRPGFGFFDFSLPPRKLPAVNIVMMCR